VSGDMSPLPGSGLDTTVKPDAGARRYSAARRSAEPSLARVMGTTVRLWFRRRVLRVPDGARTGALRWSGVTAAVLVVAGAAAGLAVWLSGVQPAPARAHHPASPPPDPALALTAANEREAGAWIMAQVAPGTSIGCDPTMCGYLQAMGQAAAQQVVLQPEGTLPGTAAVIVATPVVRAQSGATLGSQAQEVIASFGTGPEQVQVRVTGTGYPTAARRAVAASAKAGRALARNRRLHLAVTAQRVLVSGRVDPRLQVVLRRLLAAHPVYVLGFGDTGPGASWPALLRSVSIGRLVRGTGRHRVSDLAAVLRLLRAQGAPYRPAVVQQRLAGGQIVLTIEFPAPSPL
jgi:hypothetical protein